MDRWDALLSTDRVCVDSIFREPPAEKYQSADVLAYNSERNVLCVTDALTVPLFFFNPETHQDRVQFRSKLHPTVLRFCLETRRFDYDQYARTWKSQSQMMLLHKLFST
jgi:hypothetical protein